MVKTVKSYRDLIEEKIDVWGIGPGLGKDNANEIIELIQRAESPMVVDADALNIISANVSILKNCRGPRLLTPHPGEMKRLAGDQKISRAELAGKFTSEFPVTLLLKGSRTVVAESGKRISYNTTGNPGMATGGMGVLILKFIGKIKFILPILLKTGGSMVLMVGVYASIWGWKWAAGFVLLLLLHECGHLLVAKKFGLAVSTPMFIPFMGAFIALKEAPRNAWMEACVGIGGPILGSLAAAACHALGLALDYPLLIALAWTAYFLNRFNPTPVCMLAA